MAELVRENTYLGLAHEFGVDVNEKFSVLPYRET